MIIVINSNNWRWLPEGRVAQLQEEQTGWKSLAVQNAASNRQEAGDAVTNGKLVHDDQYIGVLGPGAEQGVGTLDEDELRPSQVH